MQRGDGYIRAMFFVFCFGVRCGNNSRIVSFKPLSRQVATLPKEESNMSDLYNGEG